MFCNLFNETIYSIEKIVLKTLISEFSARESHSPYAKDACELSLAMKKGQREFLIGI